MEDEFANWLSNEAEHLVIVWVNGFKPRGDDARPDRGLAPLARMLVGEDCEVITFVYGPAPLAHWNDLDRYPMKLIKRNGLWEAVLGASDGILIDSSTKPSHTPRGYRKSTWKAAGNKQQKKPLNTNAMVLKYGEQDVDTALHLTFHLLGNNLAFEGLCNPPGGDWSGISFRWESNGLEYRWLTLPRVSKDGAKRPDHVFALFGYEERPVCLCIESKDKANKLKTDIGPRLTRYTDVLFMEPPSIFRCDEKTRWSIYKGDWKPKDIRYLSAGAYLANENDPFHGLQPNLNLDVQIGVVFSEAGQKCTLQMRGDTYKGREFVHYLTSLPIWGKNWDSKY